MKDKFFKNISASGFRWIYMVLFIVAAYWLTAWHNADYLRRVDELSLFLPDVRFGLGCMKVPGGLLSWGGCLLTQFFYYPWLGSSLLILLLLVLAHVINKVYRMPMWAAPLAFVPAFMLLWAVLVPGYMIYIMKSPGYSFSNLLGVLSAVLIYGAYYRARLWKWRWLLPLSGVLFYPFLGAYALLSCLLCAVYELSTRCSGWGWVVVVTVISGLLVPYLYYLLVYSQIRLEDIYTVALPSFDYTKAEICLWLPFVLTGVCLLLFQYFTVKVDSVKYKPIYGWCLPVIFVAALAVTIYCSEHDANFRKTLRMEAALDNGDWKKTLEYAAENNDVEPTRLVVMMRNLALQKLGTAGDYMFKYPDGSAAYDIPRLTQPLRLIGAHSLYFHYGKINFCYRWCMEDMVEYGMKVEYLKYMVRCALVNREMPLAAKYIKMLKKTWFHREWAEHYEKYLAEPSLMKTSPEFSAVFPLMAYDSQLDGDGGLLEIYLLNNFAYMEGGPRELVELSLQCNMIQKNIVGFWPRFMLYARTNKRIPVHYQEAALLFSYLERKVDVSGLPLDKNVMERFEQLIKLSEILQSQSEDASREAFRSRFGDTYWYYYFFVKGLKAN